MSDHLKIEEPLFKGRPHGWIQWKGTDVCIDLHCECGALLHYDGDFLYYFVCTHCNRLWEMGTHIPIYEVPAEKRDEVMKAGMVKHPGDDVDYVEDGSVASKEPPSPAAAQPTEGAPAEQP